MSWLSCNFCKGWNVQPFNMERLRDPSFCTIPKVLRWFRCLPSECDGFMVLQKDYPFRQKWRQGGRERLSNQSAEYDGDHLSRMCWHWNECWGYFTELYQQVICHLENLYFIPFSSHFSFCFGWLHISVDQSGHGGHGLVRTHRVRERLAAHPLWPVRTPCGATRLALECQWAQMAYLFV